MQQKNKFAYVALMVVCIVWGTTYFSLRIGVSTFPPFLFSGIRQTLAGAILLLILKLFGKLKLTKKSIYQQLILGILLLTIGNGVIGWSERYISSGLAALIVSILPVYIIFINYAVGLEKRKPNRYIINGLILGCSGIVLIFRDNLKELLDTEYLLGILLAFGACLSWAIGSVYSKQIVSDGNVLSNAALQMLLSGIVLFIISYILDDYSMIEHVSSESIWALVYLIIMGSVVSYPCYLYAIQELPIGIVSLYAYINPLIALLLGFFFLNEKITWMTLTAFIVVVCGIYCINLGYQKMSKKEINPNIIE